MKIVCVINSLGPGGAERVLSELASEWAEQGHSVKMLLFSGNEAEHFHKPSKFVSISSLGIGTSALSGLSKLFALLPGTLKLRNAIKASEPDCVVSFMDQANILSIWASLGLDIPVIVSERIDPSRSSLMTSTKSRLLRSFLNCFRSFTYRFAKAIVVQTKGAGDFFPARLHGKIKIIPNSVSISNLDNPDYDLSKPCILAIGRLEQQKRFDLLIDAFSELSSNFPDWNLYIFGEGSLRDKLLKQINSLKLDSRISMSGLTNTPQALLRECEIFVLCSDYEGFPGALCEAMAVGTAVVATNCHFGPSEIIDDGENGLLISKSNLNELVHSLERLIVDSQLRSTLASNSKTIVDRFSRDVVLEKWRSLIQESTNK